MNFLINSANVYCEPTNSNIELKIENIIYSFKKLNIFLQANMYITNYNTKRNELDAVREILAKWNKNIEEQL